MTTIQEVQRDASFKTHSAQRQDQANIEWLPRTNKLKNETGTQTPRLAWRGSFIILLSHHMIPPLECERGPNAECFQKRDVWLFISRSDKHLQTSLGQQTYIKPAASEEPTGRDGCTWPCSGMRRGRISTQTHWSKRLLPNAISSMWSSSLRSAPSGREDVEHHYSSKNRLQVPTNVNKTTRITLKLSIKWLTFVLSNLCIKMSFRTMQEQSSCW